MLDLERIRRIGPFVTLCVVTLWGAYLRFVHLEQQSLWIDEAFSISVARQILEHGRPLMHDGATVWNYYPAHLLMAVSLNVFDSMEVGARFIPALLGTLLIPAVFLFGRKLTASPWTGLLAAVILSLLAYQIGWCRQARFYALLQLLIIVGFWTVLRAYERPSLWRVFWATGVGCLALATHPAGGLIPLFALLCGLFHPIDWRVGWQWASTYRMAWFCALTVLVLIAATTPVPARLFGMLPINNHYTEANYAAEYARLLGHLFGWTLIWILAGLAAGLRQWPRIMGPLLLTVSAFALMISHYNFLFHFRYILPVLPVIVVLIGYGIVVCARFAWGQPSIWRKLKLGPFILTLALTLPTAQWTLLPRSHYDLGFTAPLANWRDAMFWIKEDHSQSGQAGHPVTISSFPVFHDLYLGESGNKYFLPHSLSGFHGHDRSHEVHSSAITIHGLQDIQAIEEAYVYLDAFGGRMLKDTQIRHVLERTRPAYRVESEVGRFPIYIWKLPLRRIKGYHE